MRKLFAICYLLFAISIGMADGAGRDAVATADRASLTARGSQTSTAPAATARGAVARTAAPARTTVTRTAAPSRVAVARTTAQRTATPARATVARTAAPVQRNANRGRAAAVFEAPTMPAPSAAPAGTSTDYKKCREVFYGCMDEFCANKDTQLKRCACSSRVNDFDGVKKDMSRVEDNLLDFSERLLSVNLDAEDAAAISTATEGELAYAQDDVSASKKILDEIAAKLKSNTSDAIMERNLSAISLSNSMDAAFDNIDSMLGASTTAKTGVALYNAALPTCREMVREVCDETGSDIAESSYQMVIAQDCNTVSKAYETMRDQALERVREGSALLEMSRLDAYQKRNADDILTCKRKMLTALTNTNVCGENMDKCMDITGRYIDPATGAAFLSVDLINLRGLLTRPDSGDSWTHIGQNERFVSFLEGKRTYLEHAMDGCQDITDMVWDEFLEDALAQIKLAQEAKLEEVRQSCTTLTTQCLADTAADIADFDARALTTFGVGADKTVNEMCASVRTACTALLESDVDDASWIGGMSDIATDKTFDTILSTCMEIGKACVIRTCTGLSGNFALCIKDTSVRAGILNRQSCWGEVVACVMDAGPTTIADIMKRRGKTATADGGDFYKEIYPADATKVHNLCNSCDTTDPSCDTCRIAERVWGNCKDVPTSETTGNAIIKTDTSRQNGRNAPQTLMSWFADSTGSEKCNATECPVGHSLAGDGSCCKQLNADESSCYVEPATPDPDPDDPTTGDPDECIYYAGQCPDGNACIEKKCTTCTDGQVWSSTASACITNACTGDQYWSLTHDACRECATEFPGDSNQYVANASNTDCDYIECTGGTLYNHDTKTCVPVPCPAPGKRFSSGACCPSGVFDQSGNCCANGAVASYPNHGIFYDICLPRSDIEVIDMLREMGELGGYSGAPAYGAARPILFDAFCVGGTFTLAANPTEENPGTCTGTVVAISTGGGFVGYISGPTTSFVLGNGTVCHYDYGTEKNTPAGICERAKRTGTIVRY